METQEASDKKNLITVRAYTLKELSLLYGVSKTTLRKWMKKFRKRLGKREGNYFTIPQVKIIFKYLELPFTLEVEE